MGQFPVTSCLVQNFNVLSVRGKVPLVHNLPKNERVENNVSLFSVNSVSLSSIFGEF